MPNKNTQDYTENKELELLALTNPTDFKFFIQSPYCPSKEIAENFHALFRSNASWDGAILILAAGKEVNPDFLKHMSLKNPLADIEFNQDFITKITSYYNAKINNHKTDLTPASRSSDYICSHVLSELATNYLIFLGSVNEASVDDIKNWVVSNKSDLRHLDLCFLDLSDLNLSDCDLSGAILTDCSFKGSDLTNSLFSEAQLQSIDFQEANLTNSNFKHSELSHVNFWKANLSQADMSGSTHNMSRGTDAKFCGADFKSSIIDRCLLSRSDFLDVDFSDAQIINTMFDCANLVGTLIEDFDTAETYVNLNNHSEVEDHEEDENLFRR